MVGFFTQTVAIRVKDKTHREVLYMDFFLKGPEEAFKMEPGRYDLLTHEDGWSGASGWYLNSDGTINTYHAFPSWFSVDQYEADPTELGKQVRFPCVVIKGA